MARTAEVGIARHLWRADLLDFAAAHLDGFDDLLAGKKRLDAELFRLDADLRRRLTDARREFDAVIEALVAGWELTGALRELGIEDRMIFVLMMNMAPREIRDAIGQARAAFDAVQTEVREARALWRSIGEAMGTRGPVEVVNHFAEPLFDEPSDDELLGGSGGSA